MFDPSLPHEIQLTHNYWFLEIPLALRFEFTNKKFSPFIESGISPSVYLTTRTTSVTDIGTDVTYQKNGTSDFTSMHLVGMVSIGTNFTVNEKFQLFGQATYRYHLTKLADAPIEEHLYNYGIEIGVRRSIECFMFLTAMTERSRRVTLISVKRRNAKAAGGFYISVKELMSRR